MQPENAAPKLLLTSRVTSGTPSQRFKVLAQRKSSWYTKSFIYALIFISAHISADFGWPKDKASSNRPYFWPTMVWPSQRIVISAKFLSVFYKYWNYVQVQHPTLPAAWFFLSLARRNYTFKIRHEKTIKNGLQSMSAYNVCDDEPPRLNILRNNTRTGMVIAFGTEVLWSELCI